MKLETGMEALVLMLAAVEVVMLVLILFAVTR
jgi:hypothetical protein